MMELVLLFGVTPLTSRSSGGPLPVGEENGVRVIRGG